MIQRKLIRWVLDPLGKISNRFSAKTRDAVFVWSGLMIFFAHFVHQSGAFEIRFLYLYTFDCLMVGLMIVSSLPNQIVPVKFDRKLLLPWCGFSVMILIAGITKSTDYLPDAASYLVMYPIVFLAWNNCDFREIQKKLVLIVQISFVPFLLINLLFFPISGQQYAGFFCNVNGAAYYLALVFACSLEEIVVGRGGKVRRLLNLAFLGISAALTIYSNSRTGELSIAATFALTAVLLFFVNRRGYGKIILHRLLPAILSIVIFFPVTLGVFDISQRVSQSFIKADEIEQPDDTSTGQTGSTAPADPSASATPPAIDKLQEIVKFNEKKAEASGKTLDQLSSGRITIWKAYWERLSFWGHSNVTDRFYIEGRGTLNSTAHLTVLDYAYQFGILAGVFYLAYNILAGIKSVRYALKNSNDLYALMPFVITVSFGAMSLFYSFSTSFYEMITFYYYLMQAPLMRREVPVYA